MFPLPRTGQLVVVLSLGEIRLDGNVGICVHMHARTTNTVRFFFFQTAKLKSFLGGVLCLKVFQ